MNKIMLVALLGGFLILGAISLTFLIDHRLNLSVAKFIEETREFVNKAVFDGEGADTGSLKRKELSPESDGAKPKKSSGRELEDSGQINQIALKPSFDVVRVNPSGDLVMAGRGSPNGVIFVYAGKKLIGQVEVDGRGEWVLIPDVPISPGSKELRLEVETETGLRITGDRRIIIYLPDGSKSGGSEKSDNKNGVLVLSVDQDGGGTEVIQRPRKRSKQQTIKDRGVRGPIKSSASKKQLLPVTIDAMDYNLSGETTINGTSEPNARLNVYFNSKLVASGNANLDGKWRIITGDSFSKSESEVRVDQVDDKGKVWSRAKMKFTRPLTPLVLKPKVSVRVERGNSLWRIARRQYGKGVLYSVIFDANRDQIENPDLIYPGQVFFVPYKDKH